MGFVCHNIQEKMGVQLDSTSVICAICSSIIVKALCYKPEGHGFKTQ
jgi:hypothetical protein